jgi:hypothetical protein
MVLQLIDLARCLLLLPQTQTSLLQSKVRSLAQMAICEGCCCGQTAKGHPPIPRQILKEAWKREQLNRTVQLTITGCLGPCDLANVVLLMTNDETVWLGDLETSDYDILLDWVRRSKEAGLILPLPESLAVHRFERFSTTGLPACQQQAVSTEANSSC